MDATTASAVAGTDQIAVLQTAGFAFATVAMINADPLSQVTKLATTITALVDRIAALEGKPSPVQRYSTSVTPGVLAVGTKILTATVTGLKAGDLVAAVPVADLPSGVAIAFVRVPSDNTIEIALEAVLTLTMSAPIAFSLGTLR